MTSFFEPTAPLGLQSPICSRRQALVATAASLTLGLQATSYAQAHGHGASAAPTAPAKVIPFDETTWQRLLTQGPRPAAYVFSTTYCASCHEAFELLRAHVQAARKPVELALVVMDAQGARALRHARHYTGLTRLYAFDGFEPAIRQSVDPQWPNVTPYIALLGREGPARHHIGVPDVDWLRQWLPQT